VLDTTISSSLARSSGSGLIAGGSSAPDPGVQIHVTVIVTIAIALVALLGPLPDPGCAGVLTLVQRVALALLASSCWPA
jgi:hypothetical protein